LEIMPNTASIIGANIKKLRKRKLKISQEKLASLVGLTAASVSRWEKGISEPSSENLEKTAEILGVSVDELARSPESKKESFIDPGAAKRAGAEELSSIIEDDFKEMKQILFLILIVVGGRELFKEKEADALLRLILEHSPEAKGRWFKDVVAAFKDHISKMTKKPEPA